MVSFGPHDSLGVATGLSDSLDLGASAGLYGDRYYDGLDTRDIAGLDFAGLDASLGDSLGAFLGGGNSQQDDLAADNFLLGGLSAGEKLQRIFGNLVRACLIEGAFAMRTFAGAEVDEDIVISGNDNLVDTRQGAFRGMGRTLNNLIMFGDET